MAGDEHAERIEQAFTLQAGAFEDPRANRVFAADSSWITEAVACTTDDLVLDVAAGTGHAARQLARRVRAVVAFDTTAAMLTMGQAAATSEGLGNVLFCRGDAEHLPFLEASFDTVVSRFAFHHLERPQAVFAEMRRCVRPGGQLMIADLLANDDPDVAARQNALEILRDPSHAQLLSLPQLVALHTAIGAPTVHRDLRSVERPLDPWLAQTATTEQVTDEIRSALRDELDGGPATGLGPRWVGGELWFTQTFGLARSIVPPQA